MPLAPGQTFASYRLEERIGEGGMGQVWRALDTSLQRTVALKFLPSGHEADPGRLARFEREARLLAALSHPRIATVYGFHHESGVRFMAMELIQGEDLSSRLRAGRIATDDALQIAVAVADALAAAHAQGIIHRDLKPANVATAPGGLVKVLDFGLARLMSAPESGDLSGAVTATALTGPTAVLGTPAYMSPEQIRGRPVDRLADVWAFGCLLYELLSGKPAFEGETASDSMAAALEREPDWSRLPVDLPAQVHWVLRRCLRKDPEARLRDMVDIRLLLEEAQGEPAGGPAGGTPPGAPAPRHAGPGLLLVAVLATAAVCTGIAMWLAPEPPATPLRRFRLARGAFNVQRGTAIALSPDGRRLAYVLQGDTWLLDLAGTEPRRLEGPEDPVGVFWSPQGTQLGIMGTTSIVRLDLEGGRPSTVCRLDPEVQGLAGTASGAGWLQDNTIAFSTGMGDMWQVTAEGGAPEVLFRRREGRDLDYHDVRALPDGSGLLFVIHGPGGIDTLGGWRDGKIVELLTLAGERLAAPVLAPQGLVLFGRQIPFGGLWAVPVAGDLSTTGRHYRVLERGTFAAVGGPGTLVTLEQPPDLPGHLLWLDRKGGRLGSTPVSSAQRSLLELSPDETRIALVERDARGWDLWMLGVEGERRSRMTLVEGDEISPTWSPGGDRLAYARGNTPETLDIFERPVDLTEDERRLAAGVFPAYDSRGETIYFSGWGPENRERIERVPSGGGTPDVLLSASARLLSPRPSPDGTLLAYVSDETGRFEVYLTRLPDATGRWQVSHAGGFWPRWRADGKELYFASEDAILAARIEPGPDLRPGPVEQLFTRPPASEPLPFGWPPGFDASDDGERFLVQAAADASLAESAVVLTQGWNGSPLD